jgi:hypothetical protein
MPRRKKSVSPALIVVLLVTALLGILGVYYYMLALKPESGAVATGTSTAKAETPYGESLEIKLGSGAQTSASWLAAESTSSQNVWTVNGTYKSQAQVTLGYSLSVTYSNVNNIKIVNLYIKAVDAADSSSYTYTLASNKALSGSSPISDSGSTTKTISQHLTDCQASTSSAQIKYYIYCQVQGTGAISGQTLTATISETWFCTLNYQQSTESASASVTPTVSVASWWGFASSPEGLAIIGMAVLVVLVAVCYKPHRHRGRR